MKKVFTCTFCKRVYPLSDKQLEILEGLELCEACYSMGGKIQLIVLVNRLDRIIELLEARSRLNKN
jgi:hypothetical protein